MSELIALSLASLPFVAFIVLVVETLRVGTGREPYPPADLLYRAYGA
jgi:hypothetical protein